MRNKLKASKHSALDAIEDGIQRDDALDVRNQIFNGTVGLVPVPGHSILYKFAALQSLQIAKSLMNVGLSSTIYNLIERTTTIRRSSFQITEERPTVEEHIETLEVFPQLINQETLVLVDDIVTKGTTLVACAQMLSKIYPEKEIKFFAAMRTTSTDLINFYEPVSSTIFYYDSGKTFRED